MRQTLHTDHRWLPEEAWRPLARALGIPKDRLVLRHVGGETRARVDQPWVVAPLDGGWTSAMRLGMQDGQLVVSEVRVYPTEPRHAQPAVWSAELLGVGAPAPPGGLATRTLRQVRLADYRRLTRQVLAHLQAAQDQAAREREAKEPGAGPLPSARQLMGLPDESAAARPRRTRAGAKPDIFYARLARDYVRLLERGHRQPVAELARRYGVKKKAQMRDMVREARERGLLPKLKKSGRPGGVLTPRALAMLGQQTSTPPRRKRR